MAPALMWTGADVLYASAGDEGPHATVWTVATRGVDGGPPGPDEVGDVARTHAEALGSSPDWSGGEVRELQDAGLTILTRSLTHSDGSTALAAYWALPGSVATGIITAGQGTSDTELLRAVALDLAAAHQPTFSLTAEEMLVLSATSGLAAPPVPTTAFTEDSPAAVRDAALLAAQGSLVARGLLTSDGVDLTVIPDLRAPLALLLDGEVSLLVSCREKDGSSSRLLGGGGDTFAELAPSQPGCLSLSTVSTRQLVTRYVRWLSPTVDAASRAEALTVSPERLQLAVAAEVVVAGTAAPGHDDLGSSPDDPLTGMCRLVSIQGLRRLVGAAAALELVWAVNRDHQVWSVKADDSSSSVVHLTPAGAGSIAEGLREALLFSGP